MFWLQIFFLSLVFYSGVNMICVGVDFLLFILVPYRLLVSLVCLLLLIVQNFQPLSYTSSVSFSVIHLVFPL